MILKFLSVCVLKINYKNIFEVFTINEECFNFERSCIFVVSWSHGNLQPDAANKLLCEVLSDVQNPQNIIAVLASDNNGNAHLSKRDESLFCNNFMVLRNRKTNSVWVHHSFLSKCSFSLLVLIVGLFFVQIRLYGTENFLMLPYRTQVESRTNSQVKSEEKNVVQNASLNLNKAMGSKRNKRRVTEIEKADIHVDDVEKKLKKAIKGTIVFHF